MKKKIRVDLTISWTFDEKAWTEEKQPDATNWPGLDRWTLDSWRNW
jgi:hypothetical protein